MNHSQKISCLFTIVVLFSCICKAQLHNSNLPIKYHNKIDDITNERQVEKFIGSLDNKLVKIKVNSDFKFKDIDYQKLAEYLKLKTFTKVDIDCNGYTDLIVIGQLLEPAVFYILDSGENRFALKSIWKLTEDIFLPKIVSEGQSVFVDLYNFQYPLEAGYKKLDSTRLVHKFGGFIEFNDTPVQRVIEHLELRTTSCFGRCPSFVLSINADRTAKYHAIQFNDPDGNFTEIIDENRYEQLCNLLNYINFPSLKNEYIPPFTDCPHYYLTIQYDHGITKVIHDYGPSGSFGLLQVYELLFDLRKNQHWK